MYFNMLLEPVFIRSINNLNGLRPCFVRLKKTRVKINHLLHAPCLKNGLWCIRLLLVLIMPVLIACKLELSCQPFERCQSLKLSTWRGIRHCIGGLIIFAILVGVLTNPYIHLSHVSSLLNWRIVCV